MMPHWILSTTFVLLQYQCKVVARELAHTGVNTKKLDVKTAQIGILHSMCCSFLFFVALGISEFRMALAAFRS